MEIRKYGAAKRGAKALVAAAALAVAAGGAMAQSNRPVTVIVPFAAGGGTDITTRAMQQGLSESLDANIIVKNTDGAGGTLGVGEAARPVRMGARWRWLRWGR
ncbi:hypothetical protein ACFSZS_18170 [Seohaeicola zhoushanensis]